MERPLPCPHCKEEIRSVVIVRLLRARVNFVSSLPRRGRVIACPVQGHPLGGAGGNLV